MTRFAGHIVLGAVLALAPLGVVLALIRNGYHAQFLLGWLLRVAHSLDGIVTITYVLVIAGAVGGAFVALIRRQK